VLEVLVKFTFVAQEKWRKLANKMLVKLSPGINFTNIIRADFAPQFLRQKSTNLKFKYKKAAREALEQKKPPLKCW
jgi:hypothetical protein